MLESIWFFLWGILWAVYFMLDGFDFGLGMLLPFMTRGNDEKRVIYASMGPVWDGNEVWLIAAGGVTFAAFPKTYAVLFSSFYTPLMFILFGLIIRAVSLEFRGRLRDTYWRKAWDTGLFLGSLVPALLFGVAFANIFRGIPIDAQGIFQGNLLTLLNPYGILGGLFFVALFLVHGALWLTTKAEGELQRRAACTAKRLWIVLFVIATLFLAATAFATRLYDNFLKTPILFLIPLACAAGLVLTRVFLARRGTWSCWLFSCLTIAGATLFGVAGLYPNLLPSTIDPAYSLTAFNTMSSPLTLKIMLGVVVVFLPIVIGYQIWVYWLFKDKVSEEMISHVEGY